MIVGIGIDICEVLRFEESLRRTPNLADRLFTPRELGRPIHSLAARFAAKEALAKALGAPVGLGWHDAEIVSAESGQPSFAISGTVAAAAHRLGVDRVHVSLTHDAGVASAFVVLES